MANIFMGHYNAVLEELLKRINIDMAIVENKPSNKAILDICKKKNIAHAVVRSYSEITKTAESLSDINLCFIASFGIILKNEFIKRCRYIINFHPGDVSLCRGRHPLPAAIINRHKMMGITVHLIDSEEIDAGPLLAKISLPIDYNKSYSYNENRLIEMLGPLTAVLIEDYLKNGRFVSCEWESERSIYHKPLNKETLNRVINLKNCREFLDEKGSD